MNPERSAACHAWSKLPCDTPMERITRRRVIGEKLMLSHVTLSRGFKVASHRHDNEQFAVVLSGRMRFGLGEEGTSDHRWVEVGAGEVVELPGGVPHSAEALEDTVIIDVFSPPSERTGVDAPRP